MKSSCISHPSKEPMLVIRKWQVDFCQGNQCAAALLSYFEYWHNVRLDALEQAQQANQVAERHGDKPTQQETLLQFHKAEDIEASLLGLFKRDAIRQGRRLLVKKGALSEHKNPVRRYRFDQTIYYLFHPEICEDFLRNRAEPPENTQLRKIANAVAENRMPVAENPHAIKETTAEITEEKEIPPNPPKGEQGEKKPSKPKKAKPADYSPEFEAAWKDYPARAGDNPKKAAWESWNARVKEGHSPEEMHEGLRRYAAFLRATEKEGTQFVKHGRQFFGPSKPFLADWSPPPPKLAPKPAESNPGCMKPFPKPSWSGGKK